MRVNLYAFLEGKSRSDQIGWQDAIEVDPLSAVVRPRSTTKRLFEPGWRDGILQLNQMLASHVHPTASSRQRRLTLIGS
jgi:hypothetical protein